MRSVETSTRILQLAATINESVGSLQEILSARGVPAPSFDEDAQFLMPLEAANARDAILDATAELHDLLLDPLILVREHGRHNNSVCLQVIARFGIAGMVSPGCRVAFADIAQQSCLSEDMIRRVLRHAVTMHVFCEPEPGMIAHTAASKLFTSPIMNDWLRVGTEELWPAAVKMVDALNKWPKSSEPNETGFSLANMSESVYDVLSSHPERANRFANSMAVFAKSPGFDPIHIIEGYDWASLGRAKVVDVGGGQGHIAMSLANRFHDLEFVVQDMDKMIAGAEAKLTAQLRDRVHFMAHDLFAPQTVQSDVLFFRWIFHNWSDKYCILILRAQIPVLRPGMKIIIQDGCLPEPGSVPRWKEKYLRSDDLSMASMFNSRERTAADWKVLLSDADARFAMKEIRQSESSALAVIEVVWDVKC